jgi:CO/xanthine dehydrogenase Mo-binding subunit
LRGKIVGMVSSQVIEVTCVLSFHDSNQNQRMRSTPPPFNTLRSKNIEAREDPRLTGAAKPAAVVTADDLARIGTRVPEFYAGDLFCQFRRTPLYLGQPIALLIFEDFDAFDQARLALRKATVVKYGEETGPVTGPPYAAFRFTRVAGPTPGAPDVYSPVKNGWVSPGKFQNTERPIWARLPIPTGLDYAEAAGYGEDIRAELAANDPAHLVLERQFETQSVDPMFLEPESGLAWYDAGRKNLELVVGVQSPYEAAESVAFLLGEADAPHKPARINMQFAYMGGGFGGRDHTPFPLYVALAAMFLPDRPVRLAHDRYQQFQGGIKRHPFKMRTRIGIDRASGKIFAFAADHELDGGGLANYSASVAAVSATAALGVYAVPKADITTVALHSRGVTAGSMRGYGTLQTMTALEVLIDEVTTALPMDPIEFRRRNALGSAGRIITGNPYIVSVRTPEILDKLEQHAIWRERAAEKAAEKRREFLSAPASLAPPKIMAAGRMLPWGRWRSIQRAGSQYGSMAPRWALVLARRSPTGSRPTWATSPTRLRSPNSIRSVH